MARLCYAGDFDGKEAWVETGVVHFDGYSNRHKPEYKLFHGTVSVFEFDGWPYVRVTVNGEDVMTMPAEMEREEFAVWDEKPIEPFFSDGWPRLAELSGNANAKVFDENQFNSEVDKLYREVMPMLAP